MFRTVLLQRAFLRLMPRQRFMNAYVANVPGPPIPLYIAGAPLVEIFPIVPITANISIGVGALSYADQFNLTVVADRDLCPDLEVFTAGVQRSLDGLEHSVALTASQPKPSPCSHHSSDHVTPHESEDRHALQPRGE
jgi:hypothetical protein